ncbi:hypothetical protein GQR58_003952 [Nymphon striatum]|nr:hypothetical protein GQR58_003952 [Nymphon striatum]
MSTPGDLPQHNVSDSGSATITNVPNIQYVLANDLMGVKPPSFNWDASDMAHQFKSFRRYCELILSTPAYSNKPEATIVNYILLWMGPQAVEIFDNWTHLSALQMAQPFAVWEAFSAYFEPKSNFRLARFQLRDMKQNQGEPIDSFVTRLKVQARKCNFTDQVALEDNLIDQIIKGIAHTHVQKRVLDQDPYTLTLDQAVGCARTFEATQAQLQQLGNTASVSYVKHKTANACKFCGRQQHYRDDCPASGQKCNKCQKIGHWGIVCLSTGKRPVSRTANSGRAPTFKNHTPSHGKQGRRSAHNKVSAISCDYPAADLYSEFENITFNSITTGSHSTQANRTEAFATVKIVPHPGVTSQLRGKVDTGAQGNVLPLRTFVKMFPNHTTPSGLPTNTTPSRVTLSAYNGTKIPQHGIINLPCKNENEWIQTPFFVADTPGLVIFGLQTSAKLGLVVLNCTIGASISPPASPVSTLSNLRVLYPDRFLGLGKFPGTHTLSLDKNVHPTQHRPRRAPVQLRDKIKAELDRMEKLDVIRPVTEPSDWVSSITYVQKPDGSLRICLDPKDVNIALKRKQRHIPTLEELTHKFSNATVFSKLDAKSGY